MTEKPKLTDMMPPLKPLTEEPEYAGVLEEYNRLNFRLSEIRVALKDCRTSPAEHTRLSAERVHVLRDKTAAESKLGQLRQVRRCMAVEQTKDKIQDRVRAATVRVADRIGRVLALRDSYRTAAKDPSRPAAVRHVLAQVEQQLTEALEKA